jgi:hypothetical protein
MDVTETMLGALSRAPDQAQAFLWAYRHGRAYKRILD